MANREYDDCSDRSFDVALLEAEFRKDKAKGMSNFTRSLNDFRLYDGSDLKTYLLMRW